jgi:hypothetical protein
LRDVERAVAVRFDALKRESMTADRPPIGEVDGRSTVVVVARDA